MTAEVAILNQKALVFAADSATTVRYWDKGERHTRYFKGANKLFDLCSAFPVGLMIYSAAALHDIPWEILVKEYRAKFGNVSSDRLSEYATRFFDFVKGADALFDRQMKIDVLLEHAMTAAARYKRAIDHSLQPVDGEAPEAFAERFERELGDALEKIDAQDVPPPLEASTPNDLAARYRDRFLESLREANAVFKFPSDRCLEIVAELGIKAVVKRYTEYLSHTGVVVGGYGQTEFFPSIEVFDCYGFLEEHFICIRSDSSRAVDRSRGAFIEPFATTSMINTFRMGISPDVFSNVRSATHRKLDELARKIHGDAGIPIDEAALKQVVDAYVEEHQGEWFRPSLSSHYDPLARVIGALPVTDMAALARSLIELQSLKERVTETSESVSGPIDVAAISKHDGFVWIDRKHYFKAELNPRFFSRQRVT